MTAMLLGAFARWVLTIVSGYLVAHHVLTSAEGDSLLSDGVRHAVLAAPALTALVWTIVQKYRSRILFLTALDSPLGTSEARVRDAVDAGFGASLTKSGRVAGLVLAMACLPIIATVSGCVKARQAVILADQSFATAVFALDDAEYQAWTTHVISDAQHAKLNPPIKQALTDVKAVTLAIKAAPTSVAVPTSLPDLLKDLNDVQAVITALQPLVPTIAQHATDANGKAIALLNQLVGGK